MLWLTIWAQPGPRPAGLLLARRNSEYRLGCEHARVCVDREHIRKTGLVKTLTQLAVLAVCLIAKYRCPRNTPATSLLYQPHPEFGLRLKLDLLGDLGLRSALRILTPLLGQIQRPPQRHRPLPAHGVHGHSDLTVTDLPQSPRVLTLDTRRVLAVLREPRVIQHPRLHINHLRNPLGRRLDNPRWSPRADRQELLQALIVSLTIQPSDQRLKRLARPILDQATQIQPAIDKLHRTVHRSEQHLAGEHLQALTHQRWIVHRLARASRYHSHHHDLLASRNQRQEGSPPQPRTPTRHLPKYY